MSQGLGPDFDRAQRVYDAQMPPDEEEIEEGTCRHRWKFAGHDEKRDVTYHVCNKCGEIND